MIIITLQEAEKKALSNRSWKETDTEFLSSKTYDDTKEKLNEERKEEYRKYLEEVLTQTISSLKVYTQIIIWYLWLFQCLC